MFLAAWNFILQRFQTVDCERFSKDWFPWFYYCGSLMLAHPAIEWWTVYCWWFLSKNSVIYFEVMCYQFLLKLHFFIKFMYEWQHYILKTVDQIHYRVPRHFQTDVNFLEELIFELNFILVERAFHISHSKRFGFLNNRFFTAEKRFWHSLKKTFGLWLRVLIVQKVNSATVSVD